MALTASKIAICTIAIARLERPGPSCSPKTRFSPGASGVWSSGATGAALTSNAFEATLPVVGHHIVSFALALFAFTTLIGWSYYSERALEYLFGVKIITPFRVAWCLAIIVGATVELSFVWLLADTLNALMALPNLIALALLSPVVFALTKEFFKTRGKSENNPF